MDNRVLPFISKYQSSLEQLFRCSKQFTVRRAYNLKCKNKVYFRDTAIKVMNCYHSKFSSIKYKEIWYKEGKLHRDEKDHETGFTLPAITLKNEGMFWYKEEKLMAKTQFIPLK